MTHEDTGNFSRKHPADTKINEPVANAIKEAVDAEGISCAAVFKIASDLGVSPAEAGRTVDLLEIRLVRCQVGLFGYSPQRSTLKPAEEVSPELEAAIQQALVKGSLPCAQAWRIAEELKLGKMEVSAAAEAMKIKIKPCQLGAF
jgi:hypothetical protein